MGCFFSQTFRKRPRIYRVSSMSELSNQKWRGDRAIFPTACRERSAALAVRIVGAAVHGQYDHLGADADPRIEIADVFIGETQAARGDVRADRLRRVGTVDAIDGAAEIHG